MGKWKVGSLVAGFGVAVLALSRASFAADEKPAPQIDPKVVEVTQALAKNFVGLKSLSVDTTLDMNIEAQGVKQQMTVSYAVAAEKPNKLALLLKEGSVGVTVVCDGKDIYAYIPMLQMYTVKPAPADMDTIWSQDTMGGGRLFLIDALLRSKPYEKMIEGVTEAKYIGEETVDDAKAHHMKFIGGGRDLDLWVSSGEKPTLLKIATDMSQAVQESGQLGGMQGVKMIVNISFKNWKMDAAIPAEMFVFQPPAGAKKVDDLMGSTTGEEENKPDLLGKAAPDFKLPIMGGGDFDMVAQRGKGVIILYFWATWCGPCEKATPALAALAGEYKDKGVILCAVNEQEEEAKIQEFLKKIGVTCAVALDKDAHVGDLYDVQVFPQTVLIGMDGTVQAIHVGFEPTMKDDLKKGIDTLLAGKKLLAEEKVEAPPK